MLWNYNPVSKPPAIAQPTEAQPPACPNGLTCDVHPRPEDTYLVSVEERAWYTMHVGPLPVSVAGNTGDYWRGGRHIGLDSV